MTSTQQGTEIEAHFLELLKVFKNATLVTQAFGGGLHGRPMSIGQTEDDGTLWFLTSLQAGKVAEVAHDPRALVSLAESDKYVVMTGEAEIVRDPQRAKSLWKEPFRVWFKGPDDPTLTLIRFRPDEGEYWNNAGAQGIKQAFRAAKAYIKGEQLKDVDDPGVHGRVLR